MAAVLVLNTPDDGRLRPKHVEWSCRNKTCIVLHQVGVSFDLYYDARKHKIKNYILFLPDFNETWIFSTDFAKNPHVSNFMKVRPVGAEMFHADGRRNTDRDREKWRNERT